MLYSGSGNLVFLVVVTAEAEVLGTIGREHELEIAAMGIVAAHASVLHRRMGEFLPLEGIDLFRVAVEAHLVPLGQEKLGEIALVHAVAGIAVAGRDRSMNKFTTNDGAFVAEKAELGTSCAELELVWRVVRFMATRAVTLFDRLMYELFRRQVFMAVPAELSLVKYRLELVLSLLDVAESAVPGGNRAMDEFVLAYSRVAFVGDASRLLISGGRCRWKGDPDCKGGKKRNTDNEKGSQ
jgi:hypothetical protein